MSPGLVVRFVSRPALRSITWQASQLQIALVVLSPVEAHPSVPGHLAVMFIALWLITIEREILGSATVRTLPAEKEVEDISLATCPFFIAFRHYSPSS